MLARLLIGARISLLVGLAVVSISATVGTVVGAIAGYAGGWLDDALGRVMDVLLAFPGILLAIALVAVLGPSLTQRRAGAGRDRVGGLRASGARPGAEGARARVRAGGARGRRARRRACSSRHVIPATLSTVTVQATLGMAGAIIAEASLSFLGLGVQPPTPSWGTMLDAGRSHLFDAPHLTVVPGLAIALLVLGFNFAGDALRDRLDPRADVDALRREPQLETRDSLPRDPAPIARSGERPIARARRALPRSPVERASASRPSGRTASVVLPASTAWSR